MVPSFSRQIELLVLEWITNSTILQNSASSDHTLFGWSFRIFCTHIPQIPIVPTIMEISFPSLSDFWLLRIFDTMHGHWVMIRWKAGFILGSQSDKRRNFHCFDASWRATTEELIVKVRRIPMPMLQSIFSCSEYRDTSQTSADKGSRDCRYRIFWRNGSDTILSQALVLGSSNYRFFFSGSNDKSTVYSKMTRSRMRPLYQGVPRTGNSKFELYPTGCTSFWE